MIAQNRSFGTVISENQPKYQKLTLIQRAAIVAAVEAGQSQSSASADFQVSRQAVSKIIQQYKETGNFTPKPASGRPKRLSPRNIRTIVREVCQNHRITNKQLVAALSFQVSLNTLRRTLHHEGICKHQFRKQILLLKKLLLKGYRLLTLDWK